MTELKPFSNKGHNAILHLAFVFMLFCFIIPCFGTLATSVCVCVSQLSETDTAVVCVVRYETVGSG